MLNAKYDAKTAQLAVELAAAKAANVAAFELANTLRAQHAKEVARHSAELAKVRKFRYSYPDTRAALITFNRALFPISELNSTRADHVTPSRAHTHFTGEGRRQESARRGQTSRSRSGDSQQTVTFIFIISVWATSMTSSVCVHSQA